MDTELAAESLHSAQQAVAILGAIATLLTTWRKSAQGDHQARTKDSAPTERAELAFVAAISALLSLAASDALVFAQDETLTSLVAFGAPLVISGVCSFTLFNAYQKAQLSVAVAACSGVTFLLLMFSHRGPLSPATNAHGILSAGESAVPIGCLLLVGGAAATAVPITKGHGLLSRRGTALTALAVLAALSLGVQTLRYAKSRVELPTTYLLADESARTVKEALTSARTLPIWAQRWLWQVCDEVALARRYWTSVREAQASITPARTDEEDDESPLQNLRRRTSHQTEDYVRRVSALSPEELRSLLALRMRWVHPIVADLAEDADVVPMPAAEAEERWQIYSEYWTQAASQLEIGANPSLKWFAEAKRIEDSKRSYMPEESAKRLQRSLRRSSERHGRRDAVLPALPIYTYGKLLADQLKEDADLEATVAMEEYIRLIQTHEYFNDLASGLSQVSAHDLQPLGLLLSSQEMSPDSALRAVSGLIKLARSAEGVAPADIRYCLQKAANVTTDTRCRTFQSASLTGEQSDALRDSVQDDELMNDGSRRVWDSLSELLDGQNGELKARKLLRLIGEPMLAWVAIVDKQPSLQTALKKDEDLSPTIDKVIEQFRAMHRDERERFLLMLGTDVIGSDEMVSASPLALPVAMLAGRSFDSFASVAGALMWSPILLVLSVCAVWLGQQGARYAHSGRQRFQERSGAPDTSLACLPTRRSLVAHLLKLRKRGTGSVAIVGARGAGKSTLLRSLCGDAREAASISCFVHAPTSFTEGEFVRDLLSGVANSVETAIAQRCGVKRAELRASESQSLTVVTIAALCTLATFVVLALYCAGTRSSASLVVAWLPLVGQALTSIVLLSMAWFAHPPRDLTRWLERNASVDTRLVALHRETTRVLKNLERKQRGQNTNVSSSPHWLIQLALVLVVVVTVVAFATLLVKDEENAALVGAVAFVIAATLAATFSSKRTVTADVASTLPVLADFRRYAEYAAREVGSGILVEGVETQERPCLVVCIDELDKISEWTKSREVLRRIKGIFEISNVYYYVSMAADARRRMVVDAVAMRDELDSSFDHVFELPPLSFQESIAVAKQYAVWVGGMEFAATQNWLAHVVFAAAGIPRDIKRYVDDSVARDDETVLQDFLGVHARRLADEALAGEAIGDGDHRLLIGALEEGRALTVALDGHWDSGVKRELAELCEARAFCGCCAPKLKFNWEERYRVRADRRLREMYMRPSVSRSLRPRMIAAE